VTEDLHEIMSVKTLKTTKSMRLAEELSLLDDHDQLIKRVRERLSHEKNIAAIA
jgi:hypothetical protein